MDPYNPEVKKENDTEDEASPSIIIPNTSLYPQFGIKGDCEGSENDQFMVEVKEEIDVKVEEEDLPPPEDPLMLCDQEGPSSEESRGEKSVKNYLGTRKMEWSKEDIIRLIETYRKRDVIWDPKHVHHFNKLRKQDAWEEIAKEMGSSADVCKKKMEYLLAALRREKMKMKKSTGTGKGAHETYTSSWFAFESMQFLWDKNQPKPTLSTIQTATSEAAEEPTEVSVEGEDLNTSLATSQERNPETRHPKSPTPKSKKPKTSAGDQRLDKAFEILTATANQVNDENQHFGNLVASKLRRYDDRVRSLIQNDILNVFVRANTGCYSTDQPFPGNVVGGPQTTHPVGFPPNFWLSHSYSDASESHDSRTSTPAVVQPSPSPSTCSVGNELNIEELI